MDTILLGSTAADRPCLDDPYEMLQHLPELFAAIVGWLDECPDAINTAWIRLVTPREDDSNCSRWDTDQLWRVVQGASFAEVPVGVRRMIRRKQRSHDVEKLVSAEYGYLVTFTAAQHQEGEQWDVSRAIGELAKALVKESEKPKKDFGELVRQRRKERGLPVLQREPVLPALPTPRTSLQLAAPVLLDEGVDRHGVEGAAHLRTSVAEFRVWQAHQALEEAELHLCPAADVEQLERLYLDELATYAAVHMASDVRDAPVCGAASPEP